MLDFHTKNLNNTETGTSSRSLFAFKPRQVLLAEHNSRSKMNNVALKEENKSKITSLTSELRGSLHNSILHYLHRHGFSKTFKRFQSEAEVQSDTWKASSLCLEDIFCKYNACNGDGNLNTSKKPGNDEGITKKKKQKGAVESDSGAIEDQSNVTNKKITESGKNCGQLSEDIMVNELETKPKKKKTKHDLDSSGQAEEVKSDVLKKPIDDTINVLEMDDSTKKTKDKKKKGIQQDKLERSTTNDNELVAEVAQKERKKKKKKSSTDSAVEDNQVNPVRTDTENETTQPDESRKEKMSSKKRKRSLSDENDNPSTEITITEESKRQKTETSKGEKSKKEGSKVDEINAQETSNELHDGQANGKLETNGGEKSGAQKSTKKHCKDSAEPKTVNAFQRVKIDEVEFAHQKLQDNSYWAKDGADIGYGAKAQEVLGTFGMRRQRRSVEAIEEV
ncbi:LisH dimerization motif-containing protein [Cynara cardunculus var. scolymus]|uniref:LisH dimerization motif-containing protein n=1 Tax=Cynara cardunculus var. scolymus TaxID=59895 RepID=A0A103XC54_CYNCS|nr:LisH dimerization motif-containing protein [Cynara cardunculus var. scolymus]